MINPATSWFEIVELPPVTQEMTVSPAGKGKKVTFAKNTKVAKQLRHFLGMVQYYRDLWARRSDMLAPLTSLVGECGQTKTTRADLGRIANLKTCRQARLRSLLS
jgi:hypothetical protein